MGNEQSTHKGLTQNGKVPEKHENGSVNGVTANITSPGIEVDARGDTTIIQDNEPLSLDLATEPDFVVVESELAKAEVISEILKIPEIPEAPVQMAEVKKGKSQKTSVFGKMFKTKTEAPADVKKVQQKETSNEDVPDEGSPAADPQPELNPREEAALTRVIENQEEVGHPQRADISTQTDRTAEVDTATQTDEDDDTSVQSSESPVEEEAAMESVMTEESLDQSVIIAEEAVEDTANEEASESPTAAIIGDEVVVVEVTENDVFENRMFRAELVLVTDNFETSLCNAGDERFNGPEETEPEIATEPESDPNRSMTEEEETTVSLGVSSDLPKVVADCIELVFSAVPESIDLVALDEEITEENAEEAGDMSADVALIQTTEPDIITPEPKEENGAPSLSEEIITLVMETICEVTHENTNPENQDTSGKELPVLTKTVILVMEESANVNVTTDYAAVPETSETDELSPVIDDKPSEKCDEEENVISELITTEELPEDEVEPETTPDVITSDENAEISEELTSDVGPETGEESQPSPAVVCEGNEMIPEAAINVLTQEFAITVSEPQEPAADNENLVEEEVIAATVFRPLSAKQELSLTAPEEPVDETSLPPKDQTVAEQLNEEAIEALSNEIEVVPKCPKEETTVQKSATEEEFAGFTIPEEPVAESIKTPEQNLLTSEEPTEENPSPCEEDANTERLKNALESVVMENKVEKPEDVDVTPVEATLESEPSVSVQEEEDENVGMEDPDEEAPPVVAFLSEPQAKPEVLVVILETPRDGVTQEIVYETDNSVDVPVENSETSDEPVAKCGEAVLETIKEELIVEEAECDAPTSEEVATEIAAEEETTENETTHSGVDSQSSKETATENLQQEAQSPPETDSSVTVDAEPEEEDAPESDNSRPEEDQEESDSENNPVMNFFKTLVTTTKTTKTETPTPDATKDQSQKESQPAATTTTAQVSEPPAAPKGMSIPPPPPPEPPKMEIGGEAAAKPVKPTPKDEPKAAAKQPEPSKGKSAKGALSKLFRPKVLLELKASKSKAAAARGAKAPAKTAAVEAPEEEPEPVVEVQVEDQEPAEEVEQPVVEEQVVDGEAVPVEELEKVDPSKTGTLEAAAKPEPPPPVQEEKKKTDSKTAFLSFFKPKAAEPKKATPAPAAEAAQTVKAKEEPKAAAKSADVVDSKQASVVSQAEDDAANVPKKLEKRNSIHLFFKHLGQKRHSTDAGVQTEPAVAAAAAAAAK